MTSNMAAINPDDLKPWKPSGSEITLEDSFKGMFSINEKMTSMFSPLGASMGEDSHFDARQSIYCLAKMVDLGMTTRALVQPKSQDQALTVDLIPMKDGIKARLLPNTNDPMILVRVTHQTKSKNSLHAARMFQASMPKNGVQAVTAASAKEMDILLDEFKQNHQSLDKRFLKTLESSLPSNLTKMEGGFISFFKPLLTAKVKREVNPCSVCGLPGKHVCSRCKVARYCSKECQRRDWKESHKKNCTIPEDKAQEKFDALKEQLGSLNVDSSSVNSDKLWVDIDPKLTPKELNYVSAISNQESFARVMKKNKKDLVHNSQDISQQKKDKMMKLKVQVAPFSNVAQNKPMMIYPQGKKFQVLAVHENVVGGLSEYCKLYEMVRKFGWSGGMDIGGLKAYLLGYITTDGLVRIMIDEVLPLQSW